MNKIIAYYLPQFHQIPENDKFWGRGFTEWQNVKSAKPLFEGHYQPRMPIDDNYYDLSNISTMRWQAKLAKKYGIYGFCFYHYWFNEKPLLEKPLEMLLNNKDIDINYCLSWANESWTNTWASSNKTIIMEQTYGNQLEWEKHFNFLKKHFMDCRYITENDKPLLIIYRPYLFDKMKEMLQYWNELAKQNGFKGIKYASQRYENKSNNKALYEYFDYHINYEPNYDECHFCSKRSFFSRMKAVIHDFILKSTNIDLRLNIGKKMPKIFNYDEMWNYILNKHPLSKKEIAGAFVDWDNTPRHGDRGSCFVGVSPRKFQEYLAKQLKHAEDEYKNGYLFLFAWNEWGEGGYLEPDKKYGFSYLEAIKEALKGK